MKLVVCFLKKNKEKNDVRTINLKKAKKIENWSRLTMTIEFLIGIYLFLDFRTVPLPENCTVPLSVRYLKKKRTTYVISRQYKYNLRTVRYPITYDRRIQKKLAELLC